MKRTILEAHSQDWAHLQDGRGGGNEGALDVVAHSVCFTAGGIGATSVRRGGLHRVGAVGWIEGRARFRSTGAFCHRLPEWIVAWNRQGILAGQCGAHKPEVRFRSYR